MPPLSESEEDNDLEDDDDDDDDDEEEDDEEDNDPTPAPNRIQRGQASIPNGRARAPSEAQSQYDDDEVEEVVDSRAPLIFTEDSDVDADEVDDLL